MRTLKVEGLSLVWQEMESEEQELAGSGWYDSVWATNKPTTRYFYDVQMPIEDDYTRLVKNQVTVDVTRNGLGARGIDIIEKTTASGSVTAFPVYDGHGNMVATLARSGTGFAVNDRRSFDAWGAVRTVATTGDPKGRYVANLGHVQDDESGLVHMRARYYEPSTGRFVREDPGHQGSNWYVYCGNNPVGVIDASGRNFGLLLMVFTLFLGLVNLKYMAPELGAAMTEFASFLSRTRDQLSVEQGWAKFMEAWTDANLLGNLGYALAAIGTGGTYYNTSLGGPALGHASTFVGGISLGLRAATLAYAYQLRLAWYIEAIDE